MAAPPSEAPFRIPGYLYMALDSPCESKEGDLWLLRAQRYTNDHTLHTIGPVERVGNDLRVRLDPLDPNLNGPTHGPTHSLPLPHLLTGSVGVFRPVDLAQVESELIEILKDLQTL